MKNTNVMKNKMNTTARGGTILAATAAAMLAMTGCNAIAPSASGPVALKGVALKGSVYGGRSPIYNASIYLYVAGTNGYYTSNSTPPPALTSILTTPVTTDINGGFTLTSDYTCSTGQQMLLVSVGGDTGSFGTMGSPANNPQAVLMAGLGDCSTLHATTFINMNEVTTVATAFALAPFMTGYNAVGTSSSNVAGLTRAMASVNKLANVNTGYAGSAAMQSNVGTTPTSTLVYTVANTLAACVNTQFGGSSGDGSRCGTLFADATPSGQPAPTDTVGLALAMAHFPTQNVTQTFNDGGAPGGAPYQPTMANAPADWTMSIKYAPAGLSTPSSTSIDGSGSVWVSNSGNSTVSVFSQTGVLTTTLTGNGLTQPTGVAIDASGNGWVSNTGGTTVSAFTPTGGSLPNSPFTVGTAPKSLAFDALGNLFVANSGSSSITELSSTGVLENTLTTGVASPSAVVINPR